MKNAAHLLADTLESWDVPPGKSPEHVRAQGSPPESMPFWERHALAALQLQSVRMHLSGLAAAGRDVSMYDEALVDWHKGVWAYTTPWNQTSGARQAVPRGSLNLLRSLAEQIAEIESLELNEQARRSLEDALEEAAAAVADAPISKEAKRYIWSLIAEARMYLKDYEIFGTDAVKRVAFELGGILTQQGEAVGKAGDPATAGRLKAAGAFIMGGFVAGYMSDMGQVAAEVTRKAIEH